jgi:membrane-bound inhibitor of C-type lysozyme
MRSISKFIALSFYLVGGAASAQDTAQIENVTYICERGATIPVTYFVFDDPDNTYVSAMVEGRLIAMRQNVSGSGALFVSIDEQQSYRWHVKGDTGVLTYLDADHTADEVVILRECASSDIGQR